MNATTKQKGGAPGGASLFSTLLGYGLLIVVIALSLSLIYGFLSIGNTAIAVIIGIIALGSTIIFFVPRLYPIRWMVPGLAFVILLVIYPIFYTVTNSFTNYSDGHLFQKEFAIDLIEQRKYAPDDAAVYDWALMRSADGTYALFLTRDNNGTLESVLAPEGAPIQVVEPAVAEAPDNYGDFTLLKAAERTAALSAVQTAVFGTGDDTVGIKTRNLAARPLNQQYVYDAATDTITDQSNGQVFVADNENGTFISQNGQADPLAPGYIVGIGLDNFERFISNPALRGPLIDIFIWTVTFSILSVVTTFSAGLLMALVLNSPDVPGRRIIQSLLIIPYAVPSIIGIMVWKALLNENYGFINQSLIDLGLVSNGIPFLTDALWAKFSIILVNLWLGYPYMMLICSGALQGIPSDVYEAAAVDGARPLQAFRSITLPLLLVTVGPLLIASFTFNFNNFMLIDVLTGGNPPIPGSPVPAGNTDILISYTYRLAFGNRGSDYGYASAITLVIFALVAIVTIFQTRINNQLETVADNG